MEENLETVLGEFEDEMKTLHPLVVEKAKEIARDMFIRKEYRSKRKTIAAAIRRAEDWFYDLEA